MSVSNIPGIHYSKTANHCLYGQDGPDWEISKITAQITWNILLKQVEGGESIVYDRPWEGPSDDAKFKNTPSYGYKPEVIQNRMSKSMKYEEGDLHFFNSRFVFWLERTLCVLVRV